MCKRVSTSSSLTAASASPATTKHRARPAAVAATLLLLCLTPPLLIFSCKTTPKKVNAYAADDQEASEADSATTEEDSAGTNSLPLPAKATAADTRALVTTHAQPAGERINSCVALMTQLASEAGNQQDMLEAQTQVTSLMGQEPDVYHWCFFQMVTKLDARLDLGGPVMSELATIFFDTMRTLWIMARGMDTSYGTDTYFTYLQTRYIQMSQQHFGRAVQVVGQPMGNLRTTKDVPAPYGGVTGKPAGAADTP